MKNKNANKSRNAGGKRKTSIPTTSKTPNSGVARGIAAYKQLLLDPCNAPFAPPPGLGPGTGLYVRHRSYFTPNVSSTVVGATKISCGVSLQPHNGSLIYKNAPFSTDTSAWTRTKFITGSFIGSASVQAYRAVAACLKWIPTGSITARSGVIHRGYAVDRVVAAGDTDPINTLSAICPKTESNTGMGDPQEVVWFPSDPSDLDFRDAQVDYTDGTGNCVMLAVDVDAVGSGTIATANGFFEITVIYEWMPNGGQGMVAPIVPPPAFTLGQVLSTMGNIGMLAVSAMSARMGGGAAVMGAFQRAAQGFVGPRVGLIGRA